MSLPELTFNGQAYTPDRILRLSVQPDWAHIYQYQDLLIVDLDTTDGKPVPLLRWQGIDYLGIPGPVYVIKRKDYGHWLARASTDLVRNVRDGLLGCEWVLGSNHQHPYELQLKRV